MQGPACLAGELQPCPAGDEGQAGLGCWVYVSAFVMCVRAGEGTACAVPLSVCVWGVCVCPLLWVPGLASLLTGPTSENRGSCVHPTQVGEA